MIGFIIWIIGLVLTIKAGMEIWKTNGDMAKKLLFIVLIIITSWLGLAFYYFYAKDVGTILEGSEAVEEGIIDEVGGLKEAMEELQRRIEKQKSNTR